MDLAGEYRLSDAMIKALQGLGVRDNYVFVTTRVEDLQLLEGCQSQHTNEEIQAAFDVARHTHALDLIREDRNKILDKTDYIMQPDYTLSTKEDWVTYRQALRDLPANSGDAIINETGELTGVVWPVKPE
jgi:hypothetical protein